MTIDGRHVLINEGGGAGGGGSPAAGAPRELPAGTAYQTAERIAGKFHSNMARLLAGLARGRLAPAEAEAKANALETNALEANRRAWAGRFGRLQNNAKHYYLAGATASPEWRAVRDAFAGARAAVDKHIIGMADVVRVGAGQVGRFGPSTLGAADRKELGAEFDKSLSTALQAQQRLHAALDAFEKEFPRTANPSGRHLYAEPPPDLPAAESGR